MKKSYLAKLCTLLSFCCVMLISVSATSSVNAQTIYTVSNTTGNVYKIDYGINPLNPVLTKIGNGIGPSPGTDFLGTLPSDNIDLTFFGGFIYGLSSGVSTDGNNTVSVSKIFKIDPLTGTEDQGYGTDGLQSFNANGGPNYEGAAEGLANDGVNLLVSHGSGSGNVSVSHRISTINTAGFTQSPSLSAEDFAPATTDTDSRDVDGLGACGQIALAVDTIPGADTSRLINYGQLPPGVFNTTLVFTDGTTVPTIGDVAFLDNTHFVLAGQLPTSITTNSITSTIPLDARLHFFELIGNVVTYQSSITLVHPDPVNTSNDIPDLGIFSVASTSEAYCTNPGTADPPGSADPKFEYVAKLVCGRFFPPLKTEAGWTISLFDRLERGSYSTTINMYNLGDKKAQIHKFIALSYPPGDQVQGNRHPLTVQVPDTLYAGHALESNCADIFSRLLAQNVSLFADINPQTDKIYYEGYLIIRSSKELKMTGVYTSSVVDRECWWLFGRPFLCAGLATKHASIDVENIVGRRLK